MSSLRRPFHVLWRPITIQYPLTIRYLLALSYSFFSLWSAQPARAGSSDVASALCESGECQAVISAVTYLGRPAFRLTDGKNEAIVVPQIGRIMRFGKIGGPNLLWNAPITTGPKGSWKNYGGDKNWLAPQSSWKAFSGQAWPPDAAFDGEAQQVEVLSGGKLRMTSPLSAGAGIRFVRTMYFDTSGEFVIEQTAMKEKGATLRASIWSITQIVPGQAVFAPINTESPYKGGYFVLQPTSPALKMEPADPKVLRVEIPTDGNQAKGKIGLDAPVSRLVSVRDGVAFLLQMDKPRGSYPDGAEGAGFPVEIYMYGDPKSSYCEMELLGPLKNFVAPSKSTQIMRWSLHDLPSGDVRSPQLVDAVEKLLYE